MPSPPSVALPHPGSTCWARSEIESGALGASAIPKGQGEPSCPE